MSCSRTQYNDTDEARNLGPSVSSEVKHSTTEPLRSRPCLEGYRSREPIGISLSILIFRALLFQPMQIGKCDMTEKMLTCTLCINTNKGSRMIFYRGCKILPVEHLFAYCHDQ